MDFVAIVQNKILNHKYLSLFVALVLVYAFNLTASTANLNAGSQLLLSQPLTVRWRYESNVTLNLTPAFDSERVYLPLAGGTIVSLKAKDGQLYWRSDMGGELSASPVADEFMVYVASEMTVPQGESRSAGGGVLPSARREKVVKQRVTPLVKS